MVPRRRRGRLAGSRALSHPYVLRGQNFKDGPGVSDATTPHAHTMAVWMREDAHSLPDATGGYGKTPAERLVTFKQRALKPPTLEVSTAGRARAFLLLRDEAAPPIRCTSGGRKLT